MATTVAIGGCRYVGASCRPSEGTYRQIMATLVSLADAVERFSRESGLEPRTMSWYRKCAARAGSVPLGVISIPVVKVDGRWMVERLDVDRAVDEHEKKLGTNSISNSETEGMESSPNHSRSSISSHYMRAAYEQLGELGESRHWFDFAYRILHKIRFSRLGKLLPKVVKDQLLVWINYLFAIHQHEAHKLWSRDDPFENLHVPNDEHLRMPVIWVVEIFPPSCFAELENVIRRNKWDKKRVWLGTREPNVEILNTSRALATSGWWRVADIVSDTSSYWLPDAHRERLPPEFDIIHLTGVQIGAGITAVLAQFQLTEAAATAVDEVWHSDLTPELVWGRGRPRAENRHFAGMRKTQESRKKLHDAARRWLAEACPGFFATQSKPQFLVDIALMENYNPALGERLEYASSEAFRALGLTANFTLTTSDDLPGLVLAPIESSLCPGLNDPATWYLWGQQDAVAAGIGSTPSENSLPNSHSQAVGICHRLSRRIPDLFVLLALSELLQVLRSKYALLRDEAQIRHGRINVRDLNHLRSSILAMSIDVVSISRDIHKFYSRERSENTKFVTDLAPWVKDKDAEIGRKPSEPDNFNELLKENQVEAINGLVAADQEYREILSTVASLGASIDAFRVARVAIWISSASVLVALITLLFVDIGDDAPIKVFVGWFETIFG